MRTTYKGREIEIPEELQASWVRELRGLFDNFNYQYASSKLRRPLFVLGESERKLGHWDRANRSIMISAHHILENSWEEVSDTLRHEMAHQYVDEVFLVRNAEPHGEAFREACKILRCDPTATAKAGSLETLDKSNAERDKILLRIKELLALAESPNEHEAANAMRMAQRYLMKYNLDLTQIDQEKNYRTTYLGKCNSRIQEYEYALSLLLEEHFFVMAIWTHSYDAVRDKSGRILQVCGTPQNLEIASYVYDYVLQVSEALWKDKKRALKTTRSPGKRGTKLQYLAGLVHGLHEKLDRQKQELVDERGLVCAGDKKLDEYFRYVNPRVRAISTSGVSRNKQFDAGRQDGHNLNINRGISGETQSRGRQISGPE